MSKKSSLKPNNIMSISYKRVRTVYQVRPHVRIGLPSALTFLAFGRLRLVHYRLCYCVRRFLLSFGRPDIDQLVEALQAVALAKERLPQYSHSQPRRNTNGKGAERSWHHSNVSCGKQNKITLVVNPPFLLLQTLS